MSGDVESHVETRWWQARVCAERDGEKVIREGPARHKHRSTSALFVETLPNSLSTWVEKVATASVGSCMLGIEPARKLYVH